LDPDPETFDILIFALQLIILVFQRILQQKTLEVVVVRQPFESHQRVSFVGLQCFANEANVQALFGIEKFKEAQLVEREAELEITLNRHVFETVLRD
jgi:hypothetical protein